MEVYEEKTKNTLIKAAEIEIGKDVSLGNNVNINTRGKFSIGDRSRLGDDVEIIGNNITIGKDLFHSKGLRIGGGGRYHPDANFKIGDRCTIHNNFINICKEVIIGNDVGLSPDVAIITHGYWLSVLEGFPAKFAGVIINDGVIVGYRSVILMGVTIGKNVVIGANSVVVKDLEENSIYAGNPAKFIKKVVPLRLDERINKIKEIISEYKKIATYHRINPEIKIEYPIISVNDCRFNVEKLTLEGTENEETDDFRDYARKWGLRFYSKRPFKSVLRVD